MPSTRRDSPKLLEALGQEQNQLFVAEPLERANRKIHRHFAAVVALERDRHTRGLQPAIWKTSRPHAFKRAPIKTATISETTHLRPPASTPPRALSRALLR